MLDIMEIADRWIVDSGASQHVTNFSRRKLITGFLEKIKEQIFETASGEASVNERISAKAKAFRNISMKILMMKSSPSLISLGQIVKEGFIFLWVPKFYPCFVCTKTGCITPLDVHNNLPYFQKGGISEIVTNQQTIEKLTGIKIENRKIVIPLDSDPTVSEGGHGESAMIFVAKGQERRRRQY